MTLALRTGLAALLTASVAFSAAAFDMNAMSDDERSAFRAEIKSYLLENPEVLMEAVEVYNQRQEAAQGDNDAALIAAHYDQLYNAPGDLILGNPDGDIVMVEFSDYRCGYCKRAHPDMKALLEGDGNIKLIVKEFPILGEASTLASRFAIATRLVEGDEVYARLHEALMETNGDITLGILKRIAKGIDINVGAVTDKMDDDEVTAQIATNHQLGSVLQINGTPSFVLEGQFLRGYVPYDAMKEIVAELRG
ncbi:DsbA family protein [Celeribacter arenosi]|uniref:DsbA family protein n=1 Tax=Celeribacter arenosi TaxID=792649 RepID=A0ABP7KD98_9RHOB